MSAPLVATPSDLAVAPVEPSVGAPAPAGVRAVAEAGDARLVRRAAQGDDEAFTRLVLDHRAGLHAYAVRMLGDHARAEDAVQDALCSAHRALRQGERPMHARAWLHEITRRTCIDHWRRATRRGEVSYNAPGALAAGDRRRLAIGDETALAAARDREALGLLRQAFGDLSSLQHDVLVQRELEGRSTGEIAERLGVEPAVVDGQISRGRRLLTRAFRDLESGERCRESRGLCDRSIEQSIGVRDRRRLVPHLHRCAPCRRYAVTVGADPSLLDRGRLGRAALLLPAPLLERIGMLSAAAGTSEATVAGGIIGLKAALAAAVLAVGGTGALVATDVVSLPVIGGGQAGRSAPADVAPGRSGEHGRGGTPGRATHAPPGSAGSAVGVPTASADAPPVEGAAAGPGDDRRAAAAAARPGRSTGTSIVGATDDRGTGSADASSRGDGPRDASSSAARRGTASTDAGPGLPALPIGTGPLAQVVAGALDRVGDAVERTAGAVTGAVGAATQPGGVRKTVGDVTEAVAGTAGKTVGGVVERVGRRVAGVAGRVVGAVRRP
ncbi:MAG: sigma-70 family RNA polymerase sigma factor, partial [Solirubrobacteraceae bacterium]